MENKEKGFTLIELLATIVIISVILGIAGALIFSIINNSKNKVNDLTKANLEEIGGLYVKELPNEVIWKENSENASEQYSCVLISLLVEKGYVDEDKLGDISDNDFVKVVKDKENNIISEEVVSSNDEMCGSIGIRVPVPKSEKVCRNFSNTELEELPLINDEYIEQPNYKVVKFKEILPEDTEYKIVNSREDLMVVNAGSYDVLFALKDTGAGDVWGDGTQNDKNVTCTINKKIPEVKFTSSHSGGQMNVGEHKITLRSNISGRLYLKVSNSDYVTTNITSMDIEAGEIEISLNIIASRTTSTYVTATVIPTGEYSKNYYSGSAVYEIASITNIKTVDKPTEAACITGLVYNGEMQDLIGISNDEIEGFKFLNREYKNAGSYQITARLLSRYVWSDGTTDNVVITCSIAKKSTDIKMENSSGKEISSIGSVIKKQAIKIYLVKGRYQNSLKNDAWTDIPGTISIEVDSNVELSSLSTHADYNKNNNSKYTAELIGKEMSGSTPHKVKIIFTPADTENYEIAEKNYNLTVTTNEATLKYDATTNGGTACSPNTKKIYYKETYGELCTPVKSGYEFMGWYTKSDSRDVKVTSNTVLSDLKNVTIYAHFRKKVTISFVQFSGKTQKTTTESGYMYNKATSISVKMPTPTSYSNSNECGEWESVGWSKGTAADSSIDYEIGKKYKFSSNLTLYAKYSRTTAFIYDYNGGNYIASRYETMYRNAYSLDKKKNIGPWTETVKKAAKRSGCTFIGWYKGSTKIISANSLKNGGTKSIQFFCDDYMISAQWAAGCS